MGQLVEPAVSKKARIAYSLPGTLPTVSGDPGQIRQVVMNLIINASDALGSKPGDITVTAKTVQLRPEDPFLAVDGGSPQPGRWVALEVSDTGCGMDAETLTRIFEPFFTTKFAGRGLGLASTLGIVRAHHGFIRVKSSPGAGTTVTVVLPPHGTAAQADDVSEQRPAAHWMGSGTVLVVDDEPQVRGLARAVLTRRGFAVIEAGDGVEGLEQAFARRPDAVVLDVSMPEMDGVEVLQKLRAGFPDLPVILSSGYPSEGLLDDEAAAGPTGYLKKPYAPRDLIECLQAVMGAATAGPARKAASTGTCFPRPRRFPR
jgi:CheY-like chemotaxis protein